MSLVTSIRDYIEVLNTQIGSREDPVSIVSLISETCPYILKMCKDTLWYLISFQGLQDNFYQPYLGSFENQSLKIFIESGLQNAFVDNPTGNRFLQDLTFFSNGFSNSFFLSLPGSIGSIIVFRRIILQGIPAGIAATLGSIIASCSIMIFVTFGARFLVLSSAFLDIFFFVGLLIPGYVILRALCFSFFRIIPSKDTLSLISIGFVHFLLGISNQSTLFKHVRDLTLVPFPTRFLGIANNTSQIFYILGFSLGTAVFAFSFFYGAVFLINWWLARSTMSRSRLMSLSENTSIICLTALSVSTISYFGTDFLLTKSSGFLPFDQSFSKTVLAPASLFKDPHNLTGVHALYPSNEFSLDPGPFDRPLDKMFRRSILLKQPSFKYRSFEELNYQGEKHWLHRGFRHGSAKPIKTVTLSTEKTKLARGRALLRSLDKAIGWTDEDHSLQTNAHLAFTNLAKEEILLDFSPPIKGFQNNLIYRSDLSFLEEKFKRLFFGQIGLLPGRLPPTPYGPFDSQEMAHKRLAFTNPVYKGLLSFDIDFFLNRQPPNHSLSTEDEQNIFLKRQLLERYINTQRDYLDKATNTNFLFTQKLNDLKKNKILSTINHESVHNWETQFNFLDLNLQEPKNFVKSVANQTYKHQFKGTLEILRQLFAVSLDCPEPSSIAGGGAWDKQLKGGKEFFKDDKGLATPRPSNPRILKFDQPLYSRVEKKKPSNISGELIDDNFFDHEELYKKTEKNNYLTEQKNKPFLEKVDISPFYVGWDNDRHQLLLTQRYLSRKDAVVLNFQKLQLKKRSDTHSENQNPQNLEKSLTSTNKTKSSFFTTWPILKPNQTDYTPKNWRIPSRSFEQMVTLEEEVRMGFEEGNEKNKGLRGSYEGFVQLWQNKHRLQDFSQKAPPFKLSRWPVNITTPSVQSDIDTFEQIEDSMFTGVKRGGFIWPGNTELKVKQN